MAYVQWRQTGLRITSADRAGCNDVENFGEWKNQHKGSVIRGGAKKLPVPWQWWTGQFGAIVDTYTFLST